MNELPYDITLSAELSLTEGKPPSEIRLFAFGETDTVKGKFILDQESAETVLSAFRDHGTDRLAFDYGHGMLNPKSADSHKAAGWFTPEVRTDGLWAAEIEWTKAAYKAIEEKEFRFFSPAVRANAATRRLTKLVNVALTNIPATKNQSPLVLDELSADETKNKETEKMQVLLDTLSVSDEAAAVAKIGEIRAELSDAHEKIEKLQALADAGIEAQKALADLEKERAVERRANAIEALCAEGKLLEKQKEFAALLSDDQFKAFTESLDVHPAFKSAPVEEPKGKKEALSDEARTIHTQLGTLDTIEGEAN